MKKIAIITIMALTHLSTGHAGSMENVSVQPFSVPYASVEGSCTWSQIDGLTLNMNPPGMHKQLFGGRLAAGIVRSYSSHLRLNAEFGGGYYGSTKVVIPASGWRNQHTIDGYDLLFGALYKVNSFDLFGQIGAMVQNNRSNRDQNYAMEIPGGLVSGLTTSKYSYTQVLPEIKLGGIYSINNNWGISLAYMHAFGSSMEGKIALYATPSVVTINGEKDIQNPTLNAVMLGLRYSFVSNDERQN